MKYTTTASICISLFATLTQVKSEWILDPAMCPYPSEDFTFFPNPDDCSQYWECYEGKKQLMSCPTNFYWNVQLGYCDYYTNVDCTTNKVTTIGPGTTVTQGTTPKWTPDCPYPSEDLIFFPDPDDCSQYYECYEGKVKLLQCPANFFWNTEKGYCDSLQNVDCTKNNNPTTAQPKTTVTATPTTGSAGTGTSATITPTAVTGYTPDPLCPYPSESLIFYPYPYDCNRYYECFEGRRYLMNCPDKLYWNADRNACDWPQNVNCQFSSTASPETTTGTTAPPTVPTTSTPFIPDPLCPYPSDDFTFFPDPNDCSQYYECIGGKKQQLKCPANFFWNTETDYCDYIQNVDCTRNYQTTTSQGPGTTSTPTKPTTATPSLVTTTTRPTTVTPATTSPPPTAATTTTTVTTTAVSLCYRHPDGSFLSDPDDCSKYIECNLGHEIIGQCPSGLLWHEVILSCDFPDHVDC